MGFAIGLNTSASETAAERQVSGKGFSPGDVVTGHDGKEFIYVSASAAVSAGNVCAISTTHTAAGATSSTTIGTRLGVAPVAIANGSYGWLQIYGVCPAIQVSASASAGADLFLTATAGQLNSGGTAGTDDVDGITLTTANGGSAGTQPGVLNYPVVID
jgi:hypothetical protein